MNFVLGRVETFWQSTVVPAGGHPLVSKELGFCVLPQGSVSLILDEMSPRSLEDRANYFSWLLVSAVPRSV